MKNKLVLYLSIVWIVSIHISLVAMIKMDIALARDLGILSKRVETLEGMCRRSSYYTNWQMSELGMLCGDAISIANSAYDMARPGVKTEFNEYTTKQLDSVIQEATNKAYMIQWAESKNVYKESTE